MSTTTSSGGDDVVVGGGDDDTKNNDTKNNDTTELNNIKLSELQINNNNHNHNNSNNNSTNTNNDTTNTDTTNTNTNTNTDDAAAAAATNTNTEYTMIHRVTRLSHISTDMIHTSSNIDSDSNNSNTNSTTTPPPPPPPTLVMIQGWIYSVRVQGGGGNGNATTTTATTATTSSSSSCNNNTASLIFLDINDGSLVTPLRCLAERRPPPPNLNNNDDGATTTTTTTTIPSYMYYNDDNNNNSHSPTKYAYLDTDMSSSSSNTTDPTSSSSSSTTTTSIITTTPLDISDYTPLSFDQMTNNSTYCHFGTSVLVLGLVTKPPPDKTVSQSLEFRITTLYRMAPTIIDNVPLDPSKYPIQKSVLKKPVAIRNLSHVRFRVPLMQQLLHIRSVALYTIHEFMYRNHIPLLDPNILTNNDCEGAGEVFTILNSDTFFHTTATEPSSTSTTTKTKTKIPPPKVNIITSSSSNAAASAAAAAVSTVAATADTATAESGGGGDNATLVTATASTTTNATTTTATCTTTAPNNTIGLTVSSQLPLEAIAMGTGSVYTCQKSFRAEKSDTNKHLAEFLHIEYEAYFITLHDLMNQVETFVKYVISNVLTRCKEQYAFLNHRTTSPEEFHHHDVLLQTLLTKPFVRITHYDAVTVLLDDARNKVMTINPTTKQSVKLKFKVKPQYGDDLGSEHEKYLVQKYGTFVFVTHWPSDIKSFYMKQMGDGTCESFDLLAPIVGELFGGSMREWRYDVLQSVMAKKQMDTSTLQWFIDLRKDGGTAPHGGWGMGFDRLVMLLTNTQSVRDIVPYPVYYGHCPY